MRKKIYAIFVLLFFSDVYTTQKMMEDTCSRITSSVVNAANEPCKVLNPSRCILFPHGHVVTWKIHSALTNKLIDISHSFWRYLRYRINSKFFLCFYKRNLKVHGRNALEMLVEPMTQYKDFASNTKFKVFPLLNEGILVRKETLQCLLDALPSEYGLIVEFWKYSNSSYIFEAPRYLFLEESGKIVLSSNESIEKISMMLNMNVGMRDSRIDTASAAFIKGILLADEQKKDEVTIEEIKWIFKIIKIYKDLSDTDIIVATILVDKLLNAIQEQKQEGLESPLEIHRLPIGLLVLNCVILAEKILHDDLYRNSDYAKIFKMNVSDINLNEQQILHMLDFRINVSLECYEEYKQKISAL